MNDKAFIFTASKLINNKVRNARQRPSILFVKLPSTANCYKRAIVLANFLVNFYFHQPMAISSSAVIAAAGAISAGTSVPSVAAAFSGYDYNVAFKMDVENYTNQHLSVHEVKVNGGYITKPPVDIKPGVKEALTGHKVGHTATGCSGTVSWTIGNSSNILVVMYCVPYNQDWYYNHCGVGIFVKGSTGGHYEMMRYNKDERFKTKVFYHDVDPVGIKLDDFTVVANMGSSHKPEIEVYTIIFNL